MSFESRLAALPKVEQHLHLEGSIRPGTARTLAERHDVSHAASISSGFTDFDGFLTAFLAGLDLLRTPSDFSDVTVALAEELSDQNVIYAEVTTTPFNHHRRGIEMSAYCDGLNEGRRLARGLGVEIGWILDIPRELEPPESQFTANLILETGSPEGIVGIGLGGPETGWPADVFDESFGRVRAAGFASLPHAGETEGPHSIWAAINSLGADRIGHGIRALEDPALIDYLAERQIPLEISMTSNVCTGVIETLEQHPIRQLADQDIIVTINTDDPAYFFTNLTAELRLAHEIHGFGLEELAAAQRAAIGSSFCSTSTRAAFEEAISAWETDGNL